MATQCRLSAKFVASAGQGMHADGGNLYLQVGEGGRARSWIFKFMSPVTGKERQMGLGPVHTIGLDEAREDARLCRQQVLRGIDPKEARDAARLQAKLDAAKQVSFKTCAKGWMRTQEVGWSPRYIRDIASKFERHVYPILGDLPVQQVDVDLVSKTLEWLHTKHPPTFANVQKFVEGTLDWASAKGYRTGDNPASMKGRLRHLLKPINKFHNVKHRESLPYQRIGEFMAQLRAYRRYDDPMNHAHLCKICNSPHLAEIEAARRAGADVVETAARFGLSRYAEERVFEQHERWRAKGWVASGRPIASYALEFAIVTASRKGQSAMARWKDIDETKRLWECPPEMHKTGRKTGRALITPLSGAAMAVHAAMREIQAASGNESEFLFPGYLSSRSGHISVTTVSDFMREEFGRTDITVHGFRTTFKTWAGEHGYPEEDSEMALGHVIGNATRNAYAHYIKRVEPRRQMMEAWGDFCGRTEPLDAKLLPFSRRGRTSSNGESAS